MTRAWSWLRRHPDAACLILVVLAASAFKLAFALRIPAFIAKDSQAYFLPAWDLVHGGQFELGLRRTPGYPLFLAGLLALVGDDLRGVVLLQHLLGIGTAALAFALGRLTFGSAPGVGRAVGVTAGLLTAVSAPLVAYEHYLLTEPLFAFMVTAMLVGLVWAIRRDQARLWLLGGLLIGLAAMVKPVAQGFLPLGLAAAFLTACSLSLWGRAGVRAGAIACGLLILGYALAVAPWTIRNQLSYNLSTPSTFGRTLIARTASYDRGFLFVDPNRPESDPTMARAARIVQQGADRGDSDGTIAQRLRQELDLDPIEVNADMRDLALHAIARQPLYFVEGSLRFGLRIFNGIEIRLRDHEAERRDVVWEDRTRRLLDAPRSDDDGRAASQLLRIWQPSTWAPLPLILFGLGLVMSLGAGRRAGLLVGAVVVFLIVASAALNGPQERYRYPVDPAIAVLMAGGVISLVGVLVSRSMFVRSVAASGPLHPTMGPLDPHRPPSPPLPQAGEGGATAVVARSSADAGGQMSPHPGHVDGEPASSPPRPLVGPWGGPKGGAPW
jgi:4-amino-4-deoxy-L-arabinose transferase-like glycosyltransferase